MSLETDLLLDRRRLKRRLIFWRVAAVLAVAACALVAFVPRGEIGSGDRIVRIGISGVIGENRRTQDAILALAKDRTVRAVIVAIDSPGGSVAGGESLHAALQRVAAAKPVVAVMGGTAASAGYMVALPSARIFARAATLTGSIGVILQTGEVSGLLAKLGVTPETLISGPMKDQPSFTRPLSPAGREYLQGVVMDMYDQFVGMVAEARKMDPARVRELADGRAYTGRQALALGLIDELGGETEAKAWLTATHKVPDNTPIRDLVTRSRYERLVDGAVDGLVEGVSAALGVRTVPAGAWAIWQGALQ